MPIIRSAGRCWVNTSVRGRAFASAARDDARPMIGGFDVAYAQRTSGGDDFGVEIIAAVQRLRRRQPRADDRGSVLDQVEPDQAVSLLENDGSADAASGAFAFLRQNKCGADIGMAGEWQFGARREDANLRGVRWLARRQYKSGLGQIELAGDRLHLRAGQRRCIGKNGERIAAEFAVGEDVDGNERNLHWRSIA